MNLEYVMVILLLIYSGILILSIAYLCAYIVCAVLRAVICSVWWRGIFDGLARAAFYSASDERYLGAARVCTRQASFLVRGDCSYKAKCFQLSLHIYL
jgi:hypothetical protein